MGWLFVFLILLAGCGGSTSYQKPQDLAVDFWNMAFYSPSKCEEFMVQNMAVAFGRGGLLAPASKEQARLFCQSLSDYTKLYTKPINITAQVGTEYEKDKRYLISVFLHHQRGEPTRVDLYVVKIKERWYVVP
ncbi:MAG: hypothetical protein ACK4ZR_06040 [Aquificaceae bacterium]